MLGVQQEFVSKVMKKNSAILIAHCLHHQENLASQTFSSKLSEILKNDVVVVTRPLPRDEDMAEDHRAPEAGQLPGPGPEVVKRQRVAKK